MTWFWFMMVVFFLEWNKIKYLSENLIKCEFIFATQTIHNFTLSKLIKSLQSHSFLPCLSITSLWSHSHFTTVFLLFSNLFLPPLLFTFRHWFLSIHSNPLYAALDPAARLKRDAHTAAAAAAFQRCFVCTNLPARLCQWLINSLRISSRALGLMTVNLEVTVTSTTHLSRADD